MDAKAVLKFFNLGRISEHLSAYIESRIELLKLELEEDVISIGAKILFFVVMLIFGTCCLLFLSITAAILLNDLLEHSFAGYFIVGTVYLILTAVVFFLKNNKWIKNVLHSIISKSFEKEK